MMTRILFCLLIAAISLPSLNGQLYQRSTPEMANVALPPIPYQLDFAGERVPLENFDTRESLLKDLLVTCYMHSRTMQTLLAASRYFPVIEPILEKNGVPEDFKYLCMAESSLNPNARSGAGAAGLWQFMPATGKEFGLLVDNGVDERYHIEKSTEAACKYLLDARARLGSWALAAASYNLGIGGVQTRQKKQGITDYYDMFLPDETMRYVFRCLTFKLVYENPEMYGFRIDSASRFKPFDRYREITVDAVEIDWAKVALDNGTNYKMLRELNPWIRDYTYKNSSRRAFRVKIPPGDFRRNP